MARILAIGMRSTAPSATSIMILLSLAAPRATPSALPCFAHLHASPVLRGAFLTSLPAACFAKTKPRCTGARRATSGATASSARFFVPSGQVEAEIKIKNSRFIANIGHTPTVESAKEFVASVKDRYPDARHHCYAFAVGHGASVTHGMSDDGEPSGTAGRPILAVVMGSTLGDLTAVVTRYFGGTKLGTGGLVKAYTESVQMALMEIKTVEKVARVRVLVSGMTYRQYGNVKGPLEVLGGVVEEETFGEGVELLLLAVEERLGETTAALQEATGGQAEIEVLEAVEG